MASEQALERADLGMAWAVKDSFVSYVRAMGDGRILLGDGAAVTSTRQFYFPFLRVDHQVDKRRFVLHFGGVVRFLAHHGLMSVVLRNPKIEVEAEAAYLSIEQGGKWVRLADLNLPAEQVEDSVTMWADVEATLSGTGVATFGENYPAGETMAPLTIRTRRLPQTGEIVNLPKQRRES